MSDQAFINGFVKRAADVGLNTSPSAADPTAGALNTIGKRLVNLGSLDGHGGINSRCNPQALSLPEIQVFVHR